MMVRRVVKVLINLGILGFVTISLAGGVNRVIWVNDDQATSYGSMSSSLIEERLGVELPSRCRYAEPQHIEFKRFQGDRLEFRCSWFVGGGMAWWPFYSEVETSNADTLKAFNAMFRTGGGNE